MATADPMPGFDPGLAHLLHLIDALARLHRREQQALQADLGLTPVELRVIAALDPGEPRTMAQVADAAECVPSNATQVIRRLVTSGLVAQARASTDRRVRTVELTERGAAVRERLRARMGHPPAWIAALDPPERAQLAQLLAVMTADAPPAGGPASPANP